MSRLVEMKKISKGFYGVEVLSKVDFFIDRGEVVALCGENGAGKSTLMKILPAVYKQDEGDIYLDGEHLPSQLMTLDLQHGRDDSNRTAEPHGHPANHRHGRHSHSLE